jgi:rhodanese-related sulfurtransferase
MSGYQEIEAFELNALLTKGALVLIDVRSDEEAARGIIPGARHIPLHLLPLRHEELADAQSLAFYCHSGLRSAQACAFMASKGRSNLYNLQGGVLAWGKAGFPLVPRN